MNNSIIVIGNNNRKCSGCCGIVLSLGEHYSPSDAQNLACYTESLEINI